MNGILLNRLRNCSKIYLDTNALIYRVEKSPRYASLLRPLFDAISRGQFQTQSSWLTLAELIVLPLRKKRYDIVNQYTVILTRARNFRLFPVDRDVARRCAEIRAEYEFKTPDCVQLATAVENRAQAFITNDGRLERYGRLEVVILDKLLQGDAPL